MTQPSRIESETAQATAARILINTIPKAGTHLLEKVVRLLQKCQATGLHLEQFRLMPYQSSADQVPADTPSQSQFEEVPLSDLARMVGGIEPWHYATGHLLFSDSLAELLSDLGVKILFILRDPRDIVVSFTQYVSQLETHYLFDDYRYLSPADQLMTSIVGISTVRLSAAVPYLPKLFDIRQLLDSMLPWMYQPDTYTTSFEKLVGPSGNGSRAEQIAEIWNIARHLDIDCSEQQITEIADQLFGSTATFRKGMIGDWRNHFTPDHIRAFKQVTGDRLVWLGYESNLDW